MVLPAVDETASNDAKREKECAPGYKESDVAAFAAVLANSYAAAALTKKAETKYAEAIKMYGAQTCPLMPEDNSDSKSEWAQRRSKRANSFYQTIGPAEGYSGSLINFYLAGSSETADDPILGSIPSKIAAIKSYIGFLEKHPSADGAHTIVHLQSIVEEDSRTLAQSKREQAISKLKEREGETIMNLDLDPEGSLIDLKSEIEERKKLSDTNPSITFSLNLIGFALLVRGSYREAEPVLKETCELREKAGKDAEGALGQSLGNLGRLYMEQGKLDAAEPLLLRAVQLRKKDKSDPNASAKSQIYLGRLYVMKGQYEKAEPLLTEVTQALGPAEISKNVRDLMAAELQRVNPGQAHLLDSISGFSGRREANPYYALALVELGELLYAQKKYDQAIEMMNKALAYRFSAPSDQAKVGSHAYELLARCSIATNNFDDAAKNLGKAFEQAKKELSPTHPRLADLWLDQANINQHKNDVTAVKADYKRAIAILETALGADNPRVQQLQAEAGKF